MKYLTVIIFIMLLNISSAQTSLTVNYLNEDGLTYKDVTSNTEVWISDNLEGKAKYALNKSNGVFKIDSLSTDCAYFHVRDQNGEIHTQKLCMGLIDRQEWKIFIGSNDCIHHFEGYQPVPFIPVFDKIYMVHSFSKAPSGDENEDWNQKNIDFKAKLDKLGLKKEFPSKYNVYTLNSERRTEIIMELSKMKEVYTLAPICFFGKPRSWMIEYFYPRVDILFLNELSVQEIEKLSKDLGIDKIEKSQLTHSIWEKYKAGVPYQIELKMGVLMDYSFLKKLEQLLLENKNVLVVKTHMSFTSTND